MLVNYDLLTGPAIVLGILFVILAVISIVAIVRSQRRALSAGRETMIGLTAVAATPLEPDGTVLADGELWRAAALGGHIGVGEKVTVVGMDGLTLAVRKKEVTQ